MTEIYCMHFHRGFFPLRCAFTANYFPLGCAFTANYFPLGCAFTANYFPLGCAFTVNIISDSKGAPFYRGLLAVGSAKVNGILNSNRDLYSTS